MTKHRDVNKCRRQEKYKMAALSGKLISGYEMANKPKIKKTERMVKKKGDTERKQQEDFLKKKRRQVMSASNGTKAGYT